MALGRNNDPPPHAIATDSFQPRFVDVHTVSAPTAIDSVSSCAAIDPIASPALRRAACVSHAQIVGKECGSGRSGVSLRPLGPAPTIPVGVGRADENSSGSSNIGALDRVVSPRLGK